MPGRNHEQIPGGDASPLIGVEGDDPGPFYLVVRFWKKEQGEIGRLRCTTREDAAMAEDAFRSAMATWVPCAGKTVVDAAVDWFERMTDWEDMA